jgi:hypothetical protein
MLSGLHFRAPDNSFGDAPFILPLILIPGRGRGARAVASAVGGNSLGRRYASAVSEDQTGRAQREGEGKGGDFSCLQECGFHRKAPSLLLWGNVNFLNSQQTLIAER